VEKPLTAMRRASSFVSNFAAEHHPGPFFEMDKGPIRLIDRVLTSSSVFEDEFKRRVVFES
jgi:hypothetical protein